VHELVTAFRDQGTLKRLDFEHRIVRPDGSLCWVAVRGQAIYEGGPLPVRLIGTLIDITERKQAEQDLRFLADLAERIRLAADTAELLDKVAQAVAEYLHVRRCLFIEIDVAHDRGVIRGEYCRGVPSVAGEYKVSDYSSQALAEIAAG